jgi:hypothetical protein
MDGSITTTKGRDLLGQYDERGRWLKMAIIQRTKITYKPSRLAMTMNGETITFDRKQFEEFLDHVGQISSVGHWMPGHQFVIDTDGNVIEKILR